MSKLKMEIKLLQLLLDVKELTDDIAEQVRQDVLEEAAMVAEAQAIDYDKACFEECSHSCDDRPCGSIADEIRALKVFRE